MKMEEAQALYDFELKKVSMTAHIYGYKGSEEEIELPAQIGKYTVIAVGQMSTKRYDFQNLKKIVIPNSVTSIWAYTFKGCESLTSINIPNSVECIGRSAFSGCEKLADITIPESVTSIGDYAFKGCTSLASITVPDSVTNIGHRAFYGCEKLAEISIPESVEYIGIDAIPPNAKMEYRA